MGDMTRLLLLLLWFGVTVSTEVDLHKRVVRGQDCPDTERDYHVAFVSSDGGLICGGSLISNNWILTAAHCWEWGMTAVVGVHPGRLSQLSPTEQLITTTPVIHADKNKWIHDIMLVKLPNPTQIQPVELPSEEDCRHLPQIAQIAGHAARTMGPNNEREDNQTDSLQCADIKFVPCDQLRMDLRRDDPHFYHFRGNNHWLCGDTCQVDISHGDSGGGVVHNHKIYGVISFHGNATHACTKPAGFMNVCKYRKWIKEVAGIGNWNKFKKIVG